MIWVGTSGYNYPEWKGSFYPADLPAAKMLPYYAARFPTVEINYTFYRMPTEKLVGRLGRADAVAVQADAEGAAAHHARQPAEGLRRRSCSAFCEVAATLGDKLGALLFQLPPNLKKDLALFDAFLDELPPKVRAAFEFRHASWLDEEVFARLAARNLALCIADSEKLSTPVRVDGRLRVLPAARRRLHAGRHRALGRHDRARDGVVPRRVRVFQARGRGQGPGVRAAADGTGWAATAEP